MGSDAILAMSVHVCRGLSALAFILNVNFGSILQRKNWFMGKEKKNNQTNQITGETFPLRESLSVLQKEKNGYIMDLFSYS